jgi:hypothetical protein
VSFNFIPWWTIGLVLFAFGPQCSPREIRVCDRFGYGRRIVPRTHSILRLLRAQHGQCALREDLFRHAKHLFACKKRNSDDRQGR